MISPIKPRTAGTRTAETLTIVLPAGRLYDGSVALLRRCGLDVESWRADERKLLWDSPDGRWRCLVARPADVPTYVQRGAADLGITGKDGLLESGGDVYELLDLGFGRCRFVLAAPVGRDLPQGTIRVASKHPRLARKYLAALGVAAEIIVLHGATELAAVAGLADAIVDAVETGKTLRDNGLEPLREVFLSSARLICNRASFQLRRAEVAAVVDLMRSATSGAAPTASAATAPATPGAAPTADGISAGGGRS